MSTIKAVDKLREKIRLDVNNPWSDLKGDLLAMCDKLEHEIEERYMELPVDADGAPIRVGDKLIAYNERFDVEGVGDGTVIYRAENDELGELFNPAATIHVKTRTLEDVLLEFGEEFEGEMDEIAPVVAKYAEEIRELLWVEQ